jgi:hypothetical protein
MSLAPGTRLGAFEVTGLLGSGGMGEVYRARDTKLEADARLTTSPIHTSRPSSTGSACWRHLLPRVRVEDYFR